MASRKTIIVASAIICLLLLTILFMDYRIRTLEGKTGETVVDTSDQKTDVEDTEKANDTEAIIVDLEEEEKNETKIDDTKNETETEDAEKEEKVDIGTLKIISYPAGAAVYIDDKKVGTAPYNNFSMPVGNYSIKLMKSGLGDYCKTAYVYK